MSARTRPVAARHTASMPRPDIGAAFRRPACRPGVLPTFLCARVTRRCGGAVGAARRTARVCGRCLPCAFSAVFAAPAAFGVRTVPDVLDFPDDFGGFDDFGDVGGFASLGRVVTSPSRTGRSEKSGPGGSTAIVRSGEGNGAARPPLGSGPTTVQPHSPASARATRTRTRAAPRTGDRIAATAPGHRPGLPTAADRRHVITT
ncbi:hypothetical protein [Streptomyces sp. NPDC053427]|uniref:hypothetical protein n=1 Tax=Streptomyces sp. NPDC053427 TaxID=3365701 RepID=UPI0037D669B4